MTDAQGNSTLDTGAIVRSLLTIAAALFPGASTVGIFAQHPSEVQTILILAGNALSALWLYLRQPHPWLREPVMDAAHWIHATFRKRPTV